MILEGAGSPGEVNLKAHDIVNMRMAQHAQAPALLVGDIDRGGGVYASFVGHVEVMAPWERRLLAGFIVNRFRGDASLLADAHSFLEQRTSRPVFGMVPWLPDLGLPQEEFGQLQDGCVRPSQACREPDIWLRTVRKAEDLGQPECVILPGSKNVPADLAWLKESGRDVACRCGNPCLRNRQPREMLEEEFLKPLDQGAVSGHAGHRPAAVAGCGLVAGHAPP